MSSADAPAPLVPLLLDDATLLALGEAGYRWKEGQGGRARYRWLLPPDWVLAADLPGPQANGLEPLCGAGDRSGRLTAILALARSTDDPETMAARGAAPG